jgi:hypothetical protein
MSSFSISNTLLLSSGFALPLLMGPAVRANMVIQLSALQAKNQTPTSFLDRGGWSRIMPLAASNDHRS